MALGRAFLVFEAALAPLGSRCEEIFEAIVVVLLDDLISLKFKEDRALA